MRELTLRTPFNCHQAAITQPVQLPYRSASGVRLTTRYPPKKSVKICAICGYTLLCTPMDTSAFLTTRWTLVRNARGDTPEARDALQELCASCYVPVVAFLRRDGRDEESARELAHEFFAHVLAGDTFGAADSARGRFRSYLLGAVKHFLFNHRRDAAREKRGGGVEHISIHQDIDTSPSAQLVDSTALPPDTAFDREWALTMIARALACLEQESGDPTRFAALRPWLTPAGLPASQAETAAQLDISEEALKVAIHRLRKRFRSLVRIEVAHTLHDPADLDDEMRHLVAALAE
jgi:DNA-directed RNA polymerase specialized sigma24 family protein